MDAKLTVVKGSATATPEFAVKTHKQVATSSRFSSIAITTTTNTQSEVASPSSDAAPAKKKTFISKESMAHMRIR